VGTSPDGVVFDGANIWVANFNDVTVTKLRASDGKVLGTFTVGNAPFDMEFDGANVWVSIAGSNVVAKL
jgi:DNA-binding beta-propeller fold protein YncE